GLVFLIFLIRIVIFRILFLLGFSLFLLCWRILRRFVFVLLVCMLKISLLVLLRIIGSFWLFRSFFGNFFCVFDRFLNSFSRSFSDWFFLFGFNISRFYYFRICSL